MSLNVRSLARIVAKVEIEFEPWFEGTIDRYVERLDGHYEYQAQFRKMSFANLQGAVRAAARELGRYDTDTDTVMRASTC